MQNLFETTSPRDHRKPKEVTVEDLSLTDLKKDCDLSLSSLGEEEYKVLSPCQSQTSKRATSTVNNTAMSLQEKMVSLQSTPSHAMTTRSQLAHSRPSQAPYIFILSQTQVDQRDNADASLSCSGPVNQVGSAIKEDEQDEEGDDDSEKQPDEEESEAENQVAMNHSESKCLMYSHELLMKSRGDSSSSIDTEDMLNEGQNGTIDNDESGEAPHPINDNQR